MEGLWGLVLLLAGISLSAARVPRAMKDVTVSVNTSQCTHLIDNRFLSMSVPLSFILNNNYSDATKSMLRGLSPAYLRVGGRDSDKLYFKSPTNVSDGIIVTMSQWTKLLELAEDTGVKLVLTANPSPRGTGSVNWDPSDVMEFLKISDKEGISRSKPNWQLGYVPDMVHSSGSTLGRDVARLRKVLDLFPHYRSARVFGPDLSLCVSPDCLRFLRDFLLQADDVINALVFQIKSEIDEREEKVAFEKLSRVISDVDEKMSTRNGLQSSTLKTVPKKQLWISETGDAEYMGGFTDALVWTLRMGRAAKVGYDVVLRRLSHVSEPTPDYWVSLLFHRLVGRAVLEAQPTLHPSVTVFAHCGAPSYKPGSVTVWGVNAAEHVVSLILPHTHTLVYTLTAGPRQGSTLLNGEDLRLTLGATLPELHPHELFTGPVNIPAYSVFFIILPDIKAPACVSSTINLLQPMSINNEQPTFLVRFSSNPNGRLRKENFSISSNGVKYTGLSEVTQGMRYVPTLNLPKQIYTTENKDNAKFGRITQSESNSDESVTSENVSSDGDTTLDDVKNENKLFGLFSLFRFKRSENTDVETYEHSSLNKRSSLIPYNSYKKFQQIYRTMDDKHFDKSQEDYLLPQDLMYKGFNDQNEDLGSTYYFPGEFYNKLRALVAASKDKLADIDDPHEAIMFKDLPTYPAEHSTLHVTTSAPNDPLEDRNLIVQTTEKLEKYYKHAASFLNEAQCANGMHNGKLKCCKGNDEPGEDTPIELESKEGIESNKNQSDKLLRANKANKLSKQIRNSNENSHIEMLYKNRMKREERENNENVQTEERPNLTSTKTPLEEDEKLEHYLEELTSEGEQLLEKFDEEYERNYLQDKSTSRDSLKVIDRSREKLTEYNSRNGLLRDNIMKTSTTQFSDTVLSTTQKNNLGTSIEVEDRSETKESQHVGSRFSTFQDMSNNKNKEFMMDLNKIQKNQFFETSSQANNKNESASDSDFSNKLEKYDQTSTLNKDAVENLALNSKHNFIDDATSHTTEDMQMEGKKLTSYMTNVHNRFKIDDLSINKTVENYPNGSSTLSSLPKTDNSASTVSTTNNNLIQFKLTKQPRNSSPPMFSLQQIKTTPRVANNNAFNTISGSQPTHLREFISNLRQQRLDALRARLDKAKQNVLNLVQRQAVNRQSKRGPFQNQEFMDRIWNLNTQQSMKNNFDGKPSNRVYPYKLNRELLHKEVEEGFNGEFSAKQRGSRSVEHSCVNDRFNDFESEDPEKVQPNSKTQLANEQLERAPLQKYLQIIPSVINNKNEESSKSDLNNVQETQDHVNRLKRSVSDDIQTNDLQVKEFLTNEIMKEGPLQDVSRFDGDIKHLLMENLNRLDTSNNDVKDEYSYTDKSDERDLETVDFEYTSTHVPPTFREESVSKDDDRSKTLNNPSIITPETKSNVDSSQNNIVSNLINKVKTFFKSITSVIINLSKST